MEYILLTTLFHIFVFGLSLSILYIFIIEPMTFRNMSNITATLAENIISDQIRKYNDKEKGNQNEPNHHKYPNCSIG